MDKEIRYALETWYESDHPLHFDPLHPAIGLAGEAGELLDLYKKERFKNGASWWDCVHCGYGDASHSREHKKCIDLRNTYTPKILDELGDLSFYRRILEYIAKHSHYDSFNEPVDEITILLADLNLFAAQFLHDLIHRRQLDTGRLQLVQDRFEKILERLNFTLDQITESNYAKLQKNDNHGWSQTRSYRA